MLRLSNAFLELSLEPKAQSFTLSSLKFPGAHLQKAKFGLDLKLPAKPNFVLNKAVENPGANTLTLYYRDSSLKLEFFVEFTLPEESVFLFQQMWLLNSSDNSIWIERFLFSDVLKGNLNFTTRQHVNTAFFSNGWQSWSPTGTWQYGQRQSRSFLFPFSHPMLYNSGTPITWRKNEFSSDMFAALLDHEAKIGLLCGFLSQREQFGSLVSRLHPEPDLRVWANCDGVELPPGGTLESDRLVWQFFDLHEPHPFSAYLQKAAGENQVKPRMKTPIGWCSWYHYFQNITPNVLRNNLNVVQQISPTLPLEVIQIDDGFQKDVGSWPEFNSKFPDGVKPLAKEIEKAGFTPGIWLAPFIVERGSKIVKDHPEWLLYDKHGRRVNSGFVWDNFGFALDLTHPDVQDYVRKVIKTAVKEWGFPYLKLDFLYAAALPGQHHNPSLTRAQILRQALELIRQAAGEQTTLLGCGCPLGPGIGIFDLMRISADVSPDWKPKAYGISAPFSKEPNMPSARNAIQNILTRANLDPFLWLNDPDCLLVREDSNLSLAEVQSLATAISLTGGAVLVSDDMTRLSPERMKIAASLLPPLSPDPVVRDLFTNTMPSQLSQTLTNSSGEWKLFALFNWQDQPADLVFNTNEWGLGEEPLLMREFWTGENAVVLGKHVYKQVPAHGVRYLAIRKLENVVYLGSDFHVSQGLEVKRWRSELSKTEFTLGLGRKANGNCYLWLQDPVKAVFLDGEPAIWQTLVEHIIQIPVRMEPGSLLHILVE